MPPHLLPASAAAFAPRASSVNVVLGSRVEPWLTQTLKRINKVKRPLNSVPQHHRCLTETLSSRNAIWTLTSIMWPKFPEAERRKDDNPLLEAMSNYQLFHIEAYIVHVDMVLRNEVAYKLTPESIEMLIEYHKDIYCVDIAAQTYNWSEKEQQVKKLHEEFVQAINRFVYRTGAIALEGLEEEGAGELLMGKSEEVQLNIKALFLPLLPPPPRVVDVVRPAVLLPDSPLPSSGWWAPTLQYAMHPPVETWRVVGSSPSPASSGDSSASIWSSSGMRGSAHQPPSPSPSNSQPYTTSSMYYSSPITTMAPFQLPLPSTYSQYPCGIGHDSFASSAWSKHPDYAMI